MVINSRRDTEARSKNSIIEENKITEVIIDSGLAIHKSLGPGLLESVYESVLAYELNQKGLYVECQVPIPLVWKNLIIGQGFKADIIVEKQIIVELKSVEKNIPVYSKQVLTYLRISGLKIGLLLNFGCSLFKDGIIRLINAPPNTRS